LCVTARATVYRPAEVSPEYKEILSSNDWEPHEGLLLKFIAEAITFVRKLKLNYRSLTANIVFSSSVRTLAEAFRRRHHLGANASSIYEHADQVDWYEE
jgi:hypothetical protein